MRFPAFPSTPIRPPAGARPAVGVLPGRLAVLALALQLGACGGGGGAVPYNAGAAKGHTGADVVTATLPYTKISLGAVQAVRLQAEGGSGATVPLAGMSDAVVVGDHIVVRSASSAVLMTDKGPLHPSTRLSVLDQQGKMLSSVDYGFSLLANYTGGWAMIPVGDGFALLQAEGGTRMFTFDGQAKARGAPIELYAPPAPDAIQTKVNANAAVVDGNGMWLATTIEDPPVNKVVYYHLKLAKFDFAGKLLTPPFELSTSTNSQVPHLAASGGSVLTSWGDGGAAMVSMWARESGAPVSRSIGTGSGQFQLYPVALDGAGKLGVLWTGKAISSGPVSVLGVALDARAYPLLPEGATDNLGEVLAVNWPGNLRSGALDARFANNSLMLADVLTGSVKAGDPVGDVLAISDYGAGPGVLSKQGNVTTVAQYGVSAGTFDGLPVLRQMAFADHAVLLIGDASRLVSVIVTRGQ